MYRALCARDPSYEGVFVAAIRTTGVFCRPTCPARKPRPENVEYFDSAQSAVLSGYRPCLRCLPAEPAGGAPDWMRPLLDEVARAPAARLTDLELRARGRDARAVGGSGGEAAQSGVGVRGAPARSAVLGGPGRSLRATRHLGGPDLRDSGRRSPMDRGDGGDTSRTRTPSTHWKGRFS